MATNHAEVQHPVEPPKIKYKQLFINNEWVDADDGSTFETFNPSTNEVLCSVSEAKQADVNKAVAAAKEAFRQDSEWRRTSPTKRSSMLSRLADLLERDRCYIASLESLNNGKIFGRVNAGDLQICIDAFRYFAGWCNKHHGKVVPAEGNCLMYTTHEPFGVCAAITPWNVPLIMLAWKTAPCLAMGNTLILKPAELTPLTALYFASLVKEAGFPAGVFNVIPGFGHITGEALSRHMDVAKLTFTGSTRVGRLIMKAAAETNFKNVTLEMGGKNPLVVCADVDVDRAVEVAHVAIFSQGGQLCCAGSRTFVHEDIYDEFVRKSVARAKSRKLGNGLDPNVEQGPQISKYQQEKIMDMINAGVKEGCTLLCGGERLEGSEGHFVTPAVIVDATDNMEISREEIFGPVMMIFKYKTVSEVIRRCNDSPFGLVAGILTNDLNRAMAFTRQVRAGTIWVNTFLNLQPSMPFGGFKQSGIGRDLGCAALDVFTETKSVYIQEKFLDQENQD